MMWYYGWPHGKDRLKKAQGYGKIDKINRKVP
jgi:hypothetical protein